MIEKEDREQQGEYETQTENQQEQQLNKDGEEQAFRIWSITLVQDQDVVLHTQQHAVQSLHHSIKNCRCNAMQLDITLPHL